MHGAGPICQCPVGDPGLSDKDSVSGALHTSLTFLQAPLECCNLVCSRERARIGVKVLRVIVPDTFCGTLKKVEVHTEPALCMEGILLFFK